MSLVLLEQKILPAAFNKTGSRFVECVLDLESSGEDQFQSNVVFVTAVVHNSDSGDTKIHLVVKFEPFNKELRLYFNTTVQFYTEVLMYNEVLPFLNRNHIVENTFAKFYYGVSNIHDPDDDVILIQDLRPLGYKLTEEKVFLDYDHLALAMAKLGRFHALSYAAKKEYHKEFLRFGQNLKESSWMDGNAWFPMIIAAFHRAIDPLLDEGKHVEVLQTLLHSIETDFLKFMRDMVAPEEPLAVICHGDFCRNNMLFRYEAGRPVDVKFFDIATARYSSPVVDIAFFLFLNSSKEVRKLHWDDLLTVYHNSLSNTIPDLEVPSLENIKKEIQQKALYGFVHCSFFLPMMLYERPPDPFELPMQNSSLETDSFQIQLGGEEGTRLLSDMVEELIYRDCLTPQHRYLA